MNWLIGKFNAILQWLYDFALWLPRKICQFMLDGLGALINAIPVPDFLMGASAAFSGIPSGVLYFASYLHIGTGFAMIMSAYVLRFTLRRIPFIG